MPDDIRMSLTLAHGLDFAVLYRPEGLARLDALFLDDLARADAALRQRLETARRDPCALSAKAESDLIIDLGPHLDSFVVGLFGIEAEFAALVAKHHALAPLYACKRLFVQRQAMRAHKPDEAAGYNGDARAAELAARFAWRCTNSRLQA